MRKGVYAAFHQLKCERGLIFTNFARVLIEFSAISRICVDDPSIFHYLICLPLWPRTVI